MNTYANTSRPLLLTTLLLAACDPSEAPAELEDDSSLADAAVPAGDVAPSDAGPETQDAWVPVNPPVDPRNACFSQGRLPVIARKTWATNCDFLGLPAGWTATALADKLPAELLSHLSGTDPYHNYCEYVLDESIPDAQAGAKYDELVWTMDLSPDIDGARDAGISCVSAMPMTGLGDDPELEGLFTDAFMDAAGRVDAADLVNASGGDVNIFLVDNWAGPDPQLAPLDEHGENLARLLAALIEGAEDAIDIVPIVGLPRMDGDVAVVHPGGGVKGTAPDLSVAFMSAALMHLDDNTGGNHARSVVNASLGGPALSEGEYASDATQSMIAAMRTLACLGVQVNFAGGNALPHEVVAGQDSNGLLFPADLDGAFPSPSAAECASMGYGAADLDANYGYAGWTTAYDTWQPHAISGVDAAGAPLANGRGYGSQTQLAANGLAAHTIDSESFMLTGTSVSSAVVSAAAALSWWLTPWSPSGYTTGVGLARNADAGAAAGQAMQMVNICMSLQDALASQNIFVACAPPNQTPYTLIGPEVEAIAEAADLDGELLTFDLGAAVEPLNHDFPVGYDMTDAMVNPAPTRPVCDNCTAGKDIQGNTGKHAAFLGMALTPWAVDLDVTQAYLHVYDGGKESAMFTLDSSMIQAMNQAATGTVIQVDFEYPDLETAQLQLNYDDGTMTLTTLLIWNGAT